MPTSEPTHRGARGVERVIDDRAIFRRRSARGYVGAVDGEMQNEQLQRRAQAGCGVIARAIVTGGDAGEQARQRRELGCQDAFRDLTLGLLQYLLEGAAIVAHIAPKPIERRQPATVQEQA